MANVLTASESVTPSENGATSEKASDGLKQENSLMRDSTKITLMQALSESDSKFNEFLNDWESLPKVDEIDLPILLRKVKFRKNQKRLFRQACNGVPCNKLNQESREDLFMKEDESFEEYDLKIKHTNPTVEQIEELLKFYKSILKIMLEKFEGREIFGVFEERFGKNFADFDLNEAFCESDDKQFKKLLCKQENYYGKGYRIVNIDGNENKGKNNPKTKEVGKQIDEFLKGIIGQKNSNWETMEGIVNDLFSQEDPKSGVAEIKFASINAMKEVDVLIEDGKTSLIKRADKEPSIGLVLFVAASEQKFLPMLVHELGHVLQDIGQISKFSHVISYNIDCLRELIPVYFEQSACLLKEVKKDAAYEILRNRWIDFCDEFADLQLCCKKLKNNSGDSNKVKCDFVSYAVPFVIAINRAVKLHKAENDDKRKILKSEILKELLELTTNKRLWIESLDFDFLDKELENFKTSFGECLNELEKKPGVGSFYSSESKSSKGKLNQFYQQTQNESIQIYKNFKEESSVLYGKFESKLNRLNDERKKEFNQLYEKFKDESGPLEEKNKELNQRFKKIDNEEREIYKELSEKENLVRDKLNQYGKKVEEIFRIEKDKVNKAYDKFNQFCENLKNEFDKFAKRKEELNKRFKNLEIEKSQLNMEYLAYFASKSSLEQKYEELNAKPEEKYKGLKDKIKEKYDEKYNELYKKYDSLYDELYKKLESGTKSIDNNTPVTESRRGNLKECKN